MGDPPLGYDEDKIIPKMRLKHILRDLENDLLKVERVVKHYFPAEKEIIPQHVEKKIEQLKESVYELTNEYSVRVEKIVLAYEKFHLLPDYSNLERLLREVKSLQLLLVG